MEEQLGLTISHHSRCELISVKEDFVYLTAVSSYLYGGLCRNGANINGTTGFDDVYILTLPAFVWIK